MITIILVYVGTMALCLGIGLITGRRLAHKGVTQKQMLTGAGVPRWRYFAYLAVALSIVIFQGFLRNQVFTRLPAGLLLYLIPFVYTGFSSLLVLFCGLNFARFYRSDIVKSIRLSGLALVLAQLIFFMFIMKYVFPLKYLGNTVDENGLTYQSTGFSCSPSSAATLLRLWKIEVTERQLGEIMFTGLGGTNLAASRHALQQFGFTGREVATEFDTVAAPGLPFLAGIDFLGINHQVVVAGLTGRLVTVLDPNLGTRIITNGEFQKIWLKAMTAVPESPHPQAPSLQPLWQDIPDFKVSQYIRTEKELLNLAAVLEAAGKNSAAGVITSHLGIRDVAANHGKPDTVPSGEAADQEPEEADDPDEYQQFVISVPGKETPVTITFAKPVQSLTVRFPHILMFPVRWEGEETQMLPLSPGKTGEALLEKIQRWLLELFPFIPDDELDLSGLASTLGDHISNHSRHSVMVQHTLFGLPVLNARGESEGINLVFLGDMVRLESIDWSRPYYYRSGIKPFTFPDDAARALSDAICRKDDKLTMLPPGIVSVSDARQPEAAVVQDLVYMKANMVLCPYLVVRVEGFSDPIYFNLLTRKFNETADKRETSTK